MSLRPDHALAAHRPLGSVTRARPEVYRALSAYSHRTNGEAVQEPAGVAAILE